MAAPCAVCGAKRAHSVHVRAVSGARWHAYEDATKGGLQGESDARGEYRRSQAHKDAMELSLNATSCWPAAYGAPGECAGEIGPSHTLSRGIAGGLEQADKYPAPPSCAWHNAMLEQSDVMREWGQTHLFTFNGRQYPFKITREWLQAEKDGVRL